MGPQTRIRTRLGRLRRLPAVLRRLYHLTEQSADDHALLEEVNQRTLALSHQVEHLQSMISQVDPVATNEIAVGVRDSVAELAVELTEQANRTSELLEELSEQRS